ncbi:conserved hypothetical protein [Theileria equi strain WA]|uniref:FAD/NAD(P)-binding domain-containing protein n=1 Tax=Theileria equi strain WA TaxID=1537102 RepID=L1LDW0_THEEQ|nr:conserved hypothetical protein [Theileria equi strain WA]EKX73541.1 conserved hypothetical protein [Theileria equi strain WA]|eukprot:XP_004832993.1 conserved hypothetical protein [Theileria equi strain WA]
MMPTRVCIVGAGPSGLYVAKALKRYIQGVKIDFFEKLDQPLGLLKFGVAPDRQSLRQTGQKLVQDDFRFFYNVTVGKDIQIPTLLKDYNFCVISCGAESPVSLKIPGDDTLGVFDSLDFIRWYNGYKYIDTSGSVKRYFNRLATLGRPTTACVIGNGNVALDVSRILLAPEESLLDTPKTLINDISAANICKVNVLGRRDWIYSKFTNSELRHLLNSPSLLSVVDPSVNIQDSTNRILQRKGDIYKSMQGNWGSEKNKILQFHFSTTAEKIHEEEGQVARLDVKKRETVHFTSIPCDLLIKCIGYTHNEIAKELEKYIDNKRVFSSGWFKSEGKGDLSATIRESVELAKLIAGSSH